MTDSSVSSAAANRLPNSETSVSEWISTAATKLTPWFDWLVSLWAVGVVTLWIRLLLNWRAVNDLWISGTPIEESVWVKTLQRTRESLGIRRQAALLQSPQAHAPMAIGWLRPAILIPVEMVTGLSAAEMRAILAHELAHVRRHDYLVNLLQHLAETVLFFHPAVWWISAEIRREREYCCDAIAAAACDGATPYARALLSIEGMRGAPALGMAASGGSLLERVRRLMGVETPARGAGGAMAAIGAVVAAGLLLAGSQRADAVDQQETDTQATAARARASEGELTDRDATALATAAHRKAAALNQLPRLHYELEYRNGDVSTMEEMDDFSLENLRKAMEAPVEKEKWIDVHSTLAWDPERFLLESYSPRLKDGEGKTMEHRQTYFGGQSEGWGRETYGDEQLTYFRRPSIEAFWKTSHPIGFKFFGLTPRKFWWGDNFGHNLGHSPVPPSMADYRHLGTEEVDGELCDIVESKGRTERLWIGRESGLIRACMEYIYQGRMNTEFYEHPVVKEIAGKTFASNNDYRDWYEQHYEGLPAEQQGRLTKTWNEAYFDEMAKESNLIYFRDYREIAPEVWLPFREDRTTWHHAGANEDKFQYIRCETRVTQASLETDLEETFKRLAPKNGDRVQDQRVEKAVVDYEWRDDVTAAEIRSLVETKLAEFNESQRLIAEVSAPMEKLVGQLAPALPVEGWIGERPDLEGKPYLIHFWATWCPPCKNDFDLLKRVAKNRAIIAVHPAGTPVQEIEETIEKSQLNYATLVSEKSKADSVGGYPVKMYPYCVIVDRDGKVAGCGQLRDVARAFGELHDEGLD